MNNIKYTQQIVYMYMMYVCMYTYVHTCTTIIITEEEGNYLRRKEGTQEEMEAGEEGLEVM